MRATAKHRVWPMAYGITLLGCLSLAAFALRQSPIPLPPPVEQAPLPTLSRPTVEQQAVLDYPLFNTARMATARTKPESATTASANEPLLLVGVVMDDGRAAALLEDARGEQRKLVRVGQVLSGWKLTGISQKSVSISAGDLRLVIPLSYNTRSGTPLASEGPQSP